MKFFLLPIVLYVSACGGTDSAPPVASKAAEPAAVATAQPQLAIPADVEITVLKETTMPGTTRDLDVRLSRRVSAAELRAIAEQLRSSDSTAYERTFIVYHLADADSTAGGWATSHFDPGLEIKILGTTMARHAALAGTPVADAPQDVIGVWANDEAFFPAHAILYSKGGKTFILLRNSDGSGRPAQVVESPTTGGRRFEAQRSGGEYFVMTTYGTLEIRDAAGVVATLNAVE